MAVYVQMVYCNRDMRPMIIGLYNKPLGIETGLYIDSDMSDSPGWPWVTPPLIGVSYHAFRANKPKKTE